VIFFAVEFFVPSFGIWGIAGTVCFVIGSIYVIDTDLVWSVEGFTVDKLMVGSIAGCVGILFLIIGMLVLKSSSRKVATGKEGLVGQKATVKRNFVSSANSLVGKVDVWGELWNAKAVEGSKEFVKGDVVEVVEVQGLTLLVK
jgi:membrane-bound serine protease (ClpP class)